MPGPSRRIDKAVPQEEKCVIALLLPTSLLNDCRERQLMSNPHHVVTKILITINTEGHLAVLTDFTDSLKQPSSLNHSENNLENVI